MMDKKMKKGMGKMKSCMPKGGTQSPKGDLGALRQMESKKVGNKFKCDRIVKSPF